MNVRKIAKIITLVWALICLAMMIFMMAKEEIAPTICWGVFSIWTLITFYKYDTN